MAFDDQTTHLLPSLSEKYEDYTPSYTASGMALKMMLAAVCALLVVVAASPLEEKALNYFARASSMQCNYNAHYSTTIGGRSFNLNGCLKNGVRCITGLPPRCTTNPNQCYTYYWYTGSLCWASKICQIGRYPSSGFCCQTNTFPSCPYVRAQEVNSMSEEEESVRICETDSNGVKHCRTLSEGVNAEVMQSSDCFCVKDDAGHKVCEPNNCDAGRQTPEDIEDGGSVQETEGEEEEECVCMSGSNGHKVCQPPNCDASRSY